MCCLRHVSHEHVTVVRGEASIGSCPGDPPRLDRHLALRWRLACLSFCLAVVALAGPLGFFAFFAIGIWILIVASLMWRHEEALPLEPPKTNSEPA